MRTVYLSAFLSFCFALAIALLSRPTPIESQLLQVQLKERFPNQIQQLVHEPLEIQAFFVDHAEDSLLVGKAQLALVRYPEMTRRILALYSEDEIFQEVLADYGDLIIPPVWFFIVNDSTLLQIKRDAEKMGAWVKQKWTSFWDDENSPSEQADTLEDISPAERGWYAILQIKAHGHDFLGQFVIDKDGQVQRLQTERALESVTSFLASGIRNVEAKWRKGDEIELGDAGWAALDVAVGISALKVLRMSRTTAQGTRTLSFSQRNAALGSSLLRGSSMGLRVAKYGATVALVYIAIKHPSVLNSIFKAIAEALGLPVWVMQLVGWTLVLFPVVFIAMTVLKPVTILLSSTLSMLLWVLNFTQSKPNNARQA